MGNTHSGKRRNSGKTRKILIIEPPQIEKKLATPRHQLQPIQQRLLIVLNRNMIFGHCHCNDGVDFAELLLAMIKTCGQHWINVSYMEQPSH
jgi:hypothetical protein